MYDEFGGRETCRRISIEFYARVARDPVLRPFFGKSFTCAIEEFAAFLNQFLGGPFEDSQRRWWLSLHESHQRFDLGPEHRNAWLKLMTETLSEIDIPQAHRTALQALFTNASAYIIDQRDQTTIPLLADRWELQLSLDQAVAAIRHRDPSSPTLIEHFKKTPAIFIGLLTLLIKSNQALDYVLASLDPTLANVPHAFNRTLLHEAAGAGSPAIVNRLLALGANPTTGALHAVANECGKPQEGVLVVQALIAAGADVNAQDHRKQRTTPLHDAARRGSLEIAHALVRAGALVNLRDRTGVTPLRRAINCKHPQLVEFLRQHHATL